MANIIKSTKNRKGFKKTYTEQEKKQYREDKNAKVKAIADMIAKLTDEQREMLLKKIGAVATIEGHKCSIYNTLFMFYQRIEMPLSIVGGFKQWQKAGRKVKKGEKGMMLLFPIHHERKDKNGEVLLNPLTGEPLIWTNFRVGYVFDITQTEKDGYTPDEMPLALPEHETIDIEC